MKVDGLVTVATVAHSVLELLYNSRSVESSEIKIVLQQHVLRDV